MTGTLTNILHSNKCFMLEERLTVVYLMYLRMKFLGNSKPISKSSQT